MSEYIFLESKIFQNVWLFLVLYFLLATIFFLVVRSRKKSEIKVLNKWTKKIKIYNLFITISLFYLLFYILIGYGLQFTVLFFTSDLSQAMNQTYTVNEYIRNMYGLAIPEDGEWLKIRQVYYHPVTTIITILFYVRVIVNIIPKKRVLIREEISDLGTHGSSKWSKEEEIYDVLSQTDVGFILGELNNRKLVHPRKTKLNQIITTIGGSGSGKTAGYVITNVLNCIDTVGESVIVTDPKGEIYNKTSNYAREKGYNVFYFNLLDMSKSMRLNLLEHVRTAEDAMSISEMIILNSGGKNSSSDPMWANAELSYFCALILYIQETMDRKYMTIKNVLELGTEFGKEPECLDALFSVLPRDSEARGYYKIFSQAEGKTRSGILIGFGSRLKLWVSREISLLTSSSDFDLSILGKEKSILYLLTRDSEKTFDLIPGLIMTQAFKVLYDQANNNETERLEVPVRVLGEEMANVAKIEELERKVSTMRSRDISIVPIFQNITQFKNRYNEGLWSEILGSSDTLVYLGSNDMDSNEFFSKMLGKGTVVTNSLSESQNSGNENEGQNLTTIGRNLLDPNEMTKTLKNKCIIIQRGLDPILADKHFYFKQDKWSEIEVTHWNKLPVNERQNHTLINIDKIRATAEALVAAAEEEAKISQDSSSIATILNDSIPTSVVDNGSYTDENEEDIISISYEDDEEENAEPHYLDLLKRN